MAKKNTENMTEEAQEAVRSAYDALSDWRDEMLAANERYSEKIFDQLSTASEAMGVSGEIIEQTRSQVQSAAKMQTDMMDKMMEAWEKQLENPGSAMNFSPEFFKQFQNMSMFTPGQGMPGMPGMPDMSQFSGMQMAPFQFWMQAAEAWQKNYASAMSVWMKSINK